MHSCCTMRSFVRLCILLRLIAFAFPFKTNITQFGNCDGVVHEHGGEYPVEIYNVHYENENGVVNKVHGKYKVRTVDTRKKELVITIFHCPETSTLSSASSSSPPASGQCHSDGTTFIESLHCDQFKGDNSGIWYMFSSAMSGSHCGETTGTFDLDDVTLRNEHLTKYISDDPEKGQYRLRMVFHKVSEAIDDTHVRACIVLKFDVL